LQIEDIARTSKDLNEWRNNIETKANVNRGAIPEIFDEGVFLFFKREVDTKDKQPLSDSAGKGVC
jgi:hypothetical protein